MSSPLFSFQSFLYFPPSLLFLRFFFAWAPLEFSFFLCILARNSYVYIRHTRSESKNLYRQAVKNDSLLYRVAFLTPLTATAKYWLGFKMATKKIDYLSRADFSHYSSRIVSSLLNIWCSSMNPPRHQSNSVSICIHRVTSTPCITVGKLHFSPVLGQVQ